MSFKGRPLRAAVIQVLVLCATFYAADVGAQGLATDRPGFINSTVSVPTGFVQVEMGLTFSDVGTVDVLVAGEPLVRWGLSDRVEARGELPSFNRTSVAPVKGAPEVVNDGFGDPRVGLKYQIGPLDEAATFDLAVVGMISIPAGSDDFGSDAVLPSVALSASKSLGPGFGVAAQLSADWLDVGDGRDFVFGATLSAGTTIGIVGLFGDLDFDIPEDATGTAVTAQVGLTVPVANNIQVDLRGALGITNTALDSLIGAGLAFGF